MTIRSEYRIKLQKELQSFIDSSTGLLSHQFSSEISCRICESNIDKHEVLFVNNGYKFVICKKCGLIFVNPLIDPIVNRSLYENSDSLSEWVNILQSRDQEKYDLDMYDAVLKPAFELTSKKSLSALDISMRGGLAARCRSLNDHSLDFFDFAGPTNRLGRKRTSKVNFYDNFEQIRSTEKKYDLIISMEAMEHFHDPKDFMDNVWELLTNGGVFCGVLSNVESLLVRILGRDAPLFDGIYQKYFFHTGTLTSLLKLMEFTDIRFETRISCKDRIIEYLNEMTPAISDASTNSLINEMAKLADAPLLGYKLIFTARKV